MVGGGVSILSLAARGGGTDLYEPLALDFDFGSDTYKLTGVSITQAQAITVTRASDKYGTEEDGGLALFNLNISVITQGVGLDIEPVAINAILQSSFANAYWVKRGTAAVTANVALAPDGSMTADLVEGITTGTNDIFKTSILTGLSEDDRGEPSLFIERITTSGTIALQNANSGSNGSWTIDLALLGNGWQRITRDHAAVTIVTEFMVASGHTSIGYQLRGLSGASKSFHTWAPQLELGETSSSPILSSGAASERQADVARGDQIASVFAGLSEGIIVLDIKVPEGNVVSFRPYFTVSDGSINNVLVIQRHPSGVLQLGAAGGGNPISYLSASGWSSGDNRVLLGPKSNGDILFQISGGSLVTLSSSLLDFSSLTNCNIGSNRSGAVRNPSIFETIQVLDEAPTPARFMELLA